MSQISMPDYWMGRDQTHASELSDGIRANAAETVRRVNQLLLLAESTGVALEPGPNGTLVSSGWRPAAINAATPGAALRSKHMSGHACDLYDPEGDLDDWCMSHLFQLGECGLYLEHPSATKGWCHLQSLAPRSGKRVFWP